MKIVYLHIGLHKTGTTSIQRSLCLSREKLLNYDINFPLVYSEPPFYDFQEDIGYNHSFSFVPAFIKDYRRYHYFKDKEIYSDDEANLESKRLLNKWKSVLNENNCNKLIISAENIVLNTTEELQNIKQFLLQYFDAVKCIVYFREYIPFATSSIQQLIKGGDYFWGGYFFRDIKSEMTKFIDVFGRENIMSRKFDRECFANGDLIDDFIKIVDPNIDLSILNKVYKNETLDKYGTIFLNEYNKKYPIYKNNKLNTKRGLSEYGFSAIASVFSKVKNNDKFDFIIPCNTEYCEKVNEQIDYVNQLLDSSNKLQKIKETTYNNYFSNEDIPFDYYIELINTYNKELEKSYHIIDSYKKDIYSLNRLKEILLKELSNNKNKILVIVRNIFAYFRLYPKNKLWFDKVYYLEQYPHVGRKTKWLFAHFIFRGVYYGYNPSSRFNTIEYILDHPYIVATGKNPYMHSIQNKAIL